jgi:hypothetical protein
VPHHEWLSFVIAVNRPKPYFSAYARSKTHVRIYKLGIYIRSINLACYLVARKQLMSQCPFLPHYHSKSRAGKVKNISQLTLLRTWYNDA